MPEVWELGDEAARAESAKRLLKFKIAAGATVAGVLGLLYYYWSSSSNSGSEAAQKKAMSPEQVEKVLEMAYDYSERGRVALQKKGSANEATRCLRYAIELARSVQPPSEQSRNLDHHFSANLALVYIHSGKYTEGLVLVEATLRAMLGNEGIASSASTTTAATTRASEEAKEDELLSRWDSGNVLNVFQLRAEAKANLAKTVPEVDAALQDLQRAAKYTINEEEKEELKECEARINKKRSGMVDGNSGGGGGDTEKSSSTAKVVDTAKAEEKAAASTTAKKEEKKVVNEEQKEPVKEETVAAQPSPKDVVGSIIVNDAKQKRDQE